MTVKHLYPNSTPALNFNFKSSRVADPRLTCVRNSIGTYVDPVSGFIKTAAANEARVGEDGLMVEEARTNSFEYSEDFSQTTHWDPINSILTFHASEVAPDGSTGVYATQPNASSGYQWLTVENSPVHTNPSCISVFAKANGYNYFFIHMSTDDAAVFNLSTGTVESTLSGNFAWIEDFGNGWYRCSVVHNTAHSGLNWGIGCRPNANHGAFTSDGSSVFIWGAQWEDNKTFPTSYIPTSGSTLQRLADDISVLNGGTFNELEHTIVNRPFGVAQAVITSGNETRVDLLPGRPIERLAVHSDRLTGNEVTAMSCDDEFWKVRVLGSSFAFDLMQTDGVVKVDWGDGTAIETLTTASHTFANGAGYHDIGLKLESGTYFRPEFRNDTEVIAVGPTPLSMKLDGSNIFRSCDIHTFDAGIKFTSIQRAFNDSLTLRVLPFIDTSETSVHGMAAFFYQNRDLQRVPLFDTSNTFNWTNAFRRCNDLKELPHFDTSNVTTFSYAFDECSTLTAIPLLDTSSALDFGNMFKSCSNLVNIPLLDLSTATSMKNMLKGCVSLQSIPKFNTSDVTRWEGAFQNCTSITSFPAIDLSSGVIFENAWNGCANLATFPANMFNNLSGTLWNKCFNNTWLGCSSLDATGVENILVSIAASGVTAPGGTGTNDRKLHIDYDTSTGGLTTNTTNAIATLKATSPAWEIYINNVLQ